VEADKKKQRAAWAAKADRQADVWKRRARNARLGSLVTEELASLLERLAEESELQYEKAGDSGDSGTEWAMQLHTDDKNARATAARIREALEANDES